MPTTRITQRTVSSSMLSGLQHNLTTMQRLQEKLSSGKQIRRPSDSPVATVEAMHFRSGIRRAEQHVRNADDGLALLATTDTALSSGLASTRRIRDLVVQGLGGAVNAQGREAIADEIDALRDSLLAVANTRHLDRPVFGGNTGAPDAYSTDGSYRGDGGEVLRTVAAGVTVAVNLDGEEVFGVQGTGSQLFEVLKGLSSALRAGDGAALSAGLVDLDTAVDRMVSAIGKVGARVNRVETSRDTADAKILGLSTSLSEAEDVDLPKTIVELQLQEVAYKAALGATARVVQPSLLDFLR